MAILTLHPSELYKGIFSSTLSPSGNRFMHKTAAEFRWTWESMIHPTIPLVKYHQLDSNSSFKCKVQSVTFTGRQKIYWIDKDSRRVSYKFIALFTFCESADLMNGFFSTIPFTTDQTRLFLTEGLSKIGDCPSWLCKACYKVKSFSGYIYLIDLVDECFEF